MTRARRPIVSHADLAEFARSWGLVLLVVAFAIVVAWAVWPRNPKKPDPPSRIPLKED